MHMILDSRDYIMTRIPIFICVGLLSCQIELSHTLLSDNLDMQFCTSSPPPCIHDQALGKGVCHGENASAAVKLELPLSIIQQVTIMDIIIHNSERFIQGLSKNPNFLGQERWRVSHRTSETENKSGLLSIRIDIHDIQPEDEFMLYVEIHVGDQILRTPAQIWFMVKDNCSIHTYQPQKEAGRSGIINENNTMLQQVYEMTREIHNKCITEGDFTGILEQSDSVILSHILNSTSTQSNLTYPLLITLLCFTSCTALGVVLLIILEVIKYLAHKSPKCTWLHYHSQCDHTGKGRNLINRAKGTANTSSFNAIPTNDMEII